MYKNKDFGRNSIFASHSRHFRSLSAFTHLHHSLSIATRYQEHGNIWGKQISGITDCGVAGWMSGFM
jgi:hypothetical protein